MDYKDLAEIYEELENTSKRLEKTSIIAKLLKKTSESELGKVMLLLNGNVFPQWDQRKVGVASRLAIKSINIASGISSNEIEKRWKKTGDLGTVAADVIKSKNQHTLFSSPLTVKKVFENLEKLATEEGKGAVDRKLKIIANLLTSAKPIEAKYIIRTILEDLRVGVGEGSIRDAIVWAFFSDKVHIKYDPKENEFDISASEREEYNKYIGAVQAAYDMVNDFSEVAVIAKTKGLKGLAEFGLMPGVPIKVMLYQKAEDMKDAFKTVGSPAALEYKYDGFRLQMHRKGDKIKLFTRRLEDVTKQFPDVVHILKTHVKSDNYILDSEVIGIDPKTKKWMPFQSVSQRIKRKYDIDRLIKEVPVMVNVFDAMQINGENLLNIPFKERRKKIEKLILPVEEKLQPAKQLVTESLEKAEKFYSESLAKGNEGIMVKSLDSPYKPGSRVGYGVKVKPIMETLDLAITGATWGEGKRANWLSSFIISCRDRGVFKEIGRFGTGVKEKKEEGLSFAELTKMLKPLIISEEGKKMIVKPKIVVEIAYEEIQKSPTYSSGFALRFPRLVRIREDKGANDATTLETIKKYAKVQRHR